MVDKDMKIMDIIINYPDTLVIFEKFNMACSACMGAIDETLQEGARMHGIEIDKLIFELNAAINK